MSFGKRLKDARSAKKLTQSAVAKLLGIDDTTISKYENDKSEPDNVTLNKLADLYGVNFNYLHGKEESEEYENNKTNFIIRELVLKYNINLDNEGEKEKLEQVIKLYSDLRKS